MSSILEFLPQADAGLAREMWRKHGVQWTVVLMSGIIPTEFQETITFLRRSSTGADNVVAAFVMGMMDLGTMCYESRCARVGEVLRSPENSYQRQVYENLSGRSEYAPPRRPHGLRAPWNPFESFCSSLTHTLVMAPLQSDNLGRKTVSGIEADLTPDGCPGGRRKASRM